MRALAPLAALALAAACAAPPVVAIRPGYDFAKVGRVALVGPDDLAGQPGSGTVVRQSLEPFLLKAGYDLVERGQVDRVLSEQAFSHTENVDPATAAQLGRILGVNALVLGSVTSAVQPRSTLYLRNVSNTTYRPVYESERYKGEDGKEHVRQKLSHYDVVTTHDQIPETYATAASVAFTVKLVDATTGSVLWTASVADDGESLSEAATKASERLVKALKKAWPVRS